LLLLQWDCHPPRLRSQPRAKSLSDSLQELCVDVLLRVHYVSPCRAKLSIGMTDTATELILWSSQRVLIMGRLSIEVEQNVMDQEGTCALVPAMVAEIGVM
jgi:hypothetical protein